DNAAITTITAKINQAQTIAPVETQTNGLEPTSSGSTEQTQSEVIAPLAEASQSPAVNSKETVQPKTNVATTEAKATAAPKIAAQLKATIAPTPKPIPAKASPPVKKTAPTTTIQPKSTVTPSSESIQASATPVESIRTPAPTEEICP
ncbi:MAG: hypothetical protein K6T85_11235, partial [Gorillibacterium sp.]|nr:hypothetical protein [Gorillibacterium sp.]